MADRPRWTVGRFYYFELGVRLLPPFQSLVVGLKGENTASFLILLVSYLSEERELGQTPEAL